MNIQEVKQKVLNEGYAIEYDNGNIEMLRKALKFIFPDDNGRITGESKFYYSWVKENWMPTDKFKDKSIKLSSITFPDEITVDKIRQLRKEFPNNQMFGDKITELFNNLK